MILISNQISMNSARNVLSERIRRGMFRDC